MVNPNAAITAHRLCKFTSEGEGKRSAAPEGASRRRGLPAARVLVEPRRRNTALAIAWAASRIRAEEPEAVMAVLPADHHVPDRRAFAAAIRKAARAARAEPVLVTLGVAPTRPDTGYGYIQQAAAIGPRHPGLYRVRRFVEKPDARRARAFLKGGRHRWNAGIFVWRADVLLQEIAVCAPDLHRALAPLRRRPRTRQRATIDGVYRRAPSLPVDVAVLERSRNVWTLPVAFAWSDVGTWERLAEELIPRGKGNVVLSGEVLAQRSNGNLILGEKRLIALLGVENLAVVDTGDVTLITKLDHSPDVRRFVAELTAQGRSELT